MSGKSTQKFSAALLELGLSCPIRTLPEATRTAAEAASAIGCQQSQIVKSIVFRAPATNLAILALTSGSNRVNIEKLGRLCGQDLSKADADFVKNATGYAIGGVPPLGHQQLIETFLDEDLFKFATVWAAAGDSHSVFEIAPGTLLAATLGTQADIKYMSPSA